MVRPCDKIKVLSFKIFIKFLKQMFSASDSCNVPLFVAIFFLQKRISAAIGAKNDEFISALPKLTK
jgi:hypothetical protein